MMRSRRTQIEISGMLCGIDDNKSWPHDHIGLGSIETGGTRCCRPVSVRRCPGKPRILGLGLVMLGREIFLEGLLLVCRAEAKLAVSISASGAVN